MTNKLVYVLLVLLVIVAGGAAYYSYALYQRVESLSQDLATYQTEQAGRVGGVSDNLVSLAMETGNRLDALGSQLSEASDEIDSLGREVAAAGNRISGVEEGFSDVAARVSGLAESLEATEAEISRAVFDARAAYREVSPATVRITNGQSIIGSGFVYDTQGHVVTAYHVIEDLTPIIIITDGGRLFNATVTGYSQISDIAVLKLSGDPAVEPVTIGDSSQIQIGQPVVAVGSPLDIRDTLTAGVISQVNRYTNYGTEDNWVPNLLQFDAPVNPGNSGGPLANGVGEVVGVVVARIVASEGDGIYYAVASNKVKRVADAIIADGSFPYPWIGVNVADLTPDGARLEGLDTINGVAVGSVDSGGPAQAAGVRTGDVIVALDGAPISDTGELTSYLGEHLGPGDETVIEVLRGNNRLELDLVIGER
jgi:S1-C subfamily serine protease